MRNNDDSSEKKCAPDCKKCHSFHNPEGETTYKCIDKVNNNTTIIIISVIASCVTIIIIIVVVFICVKKYRRKKQLPKQSSNFLGGNLHIYKNLKIKQQVTNNNMNMSSSESSDRIVPFQQTEQTNQSKKKIRKKLNIDMGIPVKRVKFQSNIPVHQSLNKKNKNFPHSLSPHKKKYEFKRKSKHFQTNIEIASIVDNTMKITERESRFKPKDKKIQEIHEINEV